MPKIIAKKYFKKCKYFYLQKINRLPNNFKLTLIDFFRRNGEIMSDDEGDENLGGP